MSAAAPDAILVTGGAGFIGTALLPHILAWGRPTVVVDCLLEQVHPGGKPPETFPAAAELIVGSVSDEAVWDEVLARYRPTLVIHLAAETGTGQSLTEGTRHATANVVGTTAMLDAFARHDVKPHIVLTSSRAIYGEGTWLDGDDRPFSPPPRCHAQLAAARWDHEDPHGRPARPAPASASTTLVNPSSIYGSTKLAQELIIRNWSASFSTPLSVLRLQNVYGPGQSPHNPYTGITTLFHRLASRGETLDVYEDGLIGRDFVIIDDVVEALLAAIEQPPREGEQRILDVGTGTVTTILDAACKIAALYGAPEPRVSGRFRDGDVRFAVADIAATSQELEWKPRVDFEEGSKRLSAWLQAGGHLG